MAIPWGSDQTLGSQSSLSAHILTLHLQKTVSPVFKMIPESGPSSTPLLPRLPGSLSPPLLPYRLLIMVVMSFLCIKPLSGPMSSEHNPEPHHSPPGPTWSCLHHILTSPSSHARARTYTQTLILSPPLIHTGHPGSLLVQQALPAPIQGPLNLLFLLLSMLS